MLSSTATSTFGEEAHPRFVFDYFPPLVVDSEEMHAMKEAVVIVVTFLANALPPAHAKGGGGGGGGGGWGAGRSSASASAASATAAAKAGGGSRSSRDDRLGKESMENLYPDSSGSSSQGGGEGPNRVGWSIASSSTSAKGSSLYRDSSGRVRSGRPRYYGAGHSKAARFASKYGKTFVKRAILWSAVVGATAFIFYHSSRYSGSQRASLTSDCPRGIRVRVRSCTHADKLTDHEHPNVYRPVPVRT